MFRLRRFLRDRHRSGWEPEDALAVQPARQPSEDSDRIVRLVSERLAEDERLRGDLTDDGFGPVLNLVTSLVPDAAERVMADPNSTSAVDEVSHDARTLTRAIVDAAESGNVDGLVKLLAEPILTAASADRACTAITNEQTWPDSPDQRARRIVEILLAAIEEER